MLVFVTSVLCSCGLPLALAKHVATEEEEGRREKLRHTCTTTLCLALLIALGVGLAMIPNVQRFEQYLHVEIGRGFALAFPLLLLCAVTSDCAQGIYMGLLRLRTVITLTTVGPSVMLLCVLARRAGAPLSLWGVVAALYISSGLLAIFKLWRDRLLGKPARLNEIRPVARDIAPAAIFNFFMIFSTWSDRWVVGTQLGAVAMGLYAVAVMVVKTILRVPSHIAFLLVPASSRVALGGTEKSAGFNETVVGVFGTFTILITIMIVLAPGAYVRLIFGPGFIMAGPVLLIMALSLPAAAVSIPFISALTGSTRNRFMLYLLGLTLPPRILLLLILTRRWGVLGTALATVLADYLLAVCCILFAREAGISFPRRALARPVLVGALALLVGFGALLLKAPQPVAIILAGAVFVPSFWQAAQLIRKLASS